MQLRALDRRNVDRGRQKIDDRVEQRLNTLVAVRRAAENGRQMIGDRALAQTGANLFLGQLFAVQVLHHQLVVGLRRGFDHLLMVFFRHFQHIRGDVDQVHLRAHFVLVHDRLHANQVDHADEARLRADRQLNRNGVRLKPLVHHIDHAVEVRAGDVHLIDIRHAGHVIFRRLTPYGFGLGLYAALGAEHGNRTVQHAQRALDLDREVHVAGRVDQVDLIAAPFAGRRRRRNRNAALLFLLHPVHRRHAVVGFTDTVRATGVVQNSLGRRCFTGIDMRHDTDIANMIQRMRSRHS